MYQINNPQTKRTLFEDDNLKYTKHIWNQIPARKHCDLELFDTETGEVIRFKERRVKEVSSK